MIQNVHISGAFDRAIFLKDGDYFLKRLDQPSVLARHFDINTLLKFGGDILVLEKTKEDKLNELIQEQSDLQGGLRLAIEGIAPREPINDKFRQPSIELLEEFLEDVPVYEFVHTRMMSKAATDDTDIGEALQIAQTHNYIKATQLYTDLQAAQPTLQAFWDLWEQVTYSMSEEELIEIEDDLVERGVFAKIIRLLQNAKLKKDVDAILFEVPPKHMRIFQKIAQQFVENQQIKEKERGEVRDIEDRPHDTKAIDQIEILLSEFDNRKKVEFLHNANTRAGKKINGIIRSIKKGRYDKIEKDLTELINFHIKYSEREHLCKSLTNIATETIKLNQYDLAERFIRYAQMANYQDSAPFSLEAELFKFKNQFDEALNIYQNIIERFPSDVVPRRGMAEVYKSQNQFDEALDIYKSIINRFPDDVITRTGLAEVYKSTNYFSKSIALYEQVIIDFPNNEVARTGLAEVYKTTNDFTKSIALYEKVIADFPNNEVARTGLAEVYKTTNDFTKSIALYEKVIADFPNNEVARTGLAEVYKSTNNYTKSIELYEQVINDFPNNEVARTGLAEVYKSTNNYTKSIELYEQVIIDFPKNVIAKRGLAEVYKSQNQFDEALNIYKKVIKQSPNDIISKSGYLHTLILAKKYDEVKSIIKNEKTKPVSHSDWVFHHTVSMYHLKAGNFDEAIQRLEYGLKNSSVREQVHYSNALAFALNKKGTTSAYKKALKHLETYSVSIEKTAAYQLHQAITALTYAGLRQEMKAKTIIGQLDKPVSRPHAKVIQLTDDYINTFNKRREIIQEMEQPFMMALAA